MKSFVAATLCALLLGCATSTMKIDTAPFQVGTAKIKITPQKPMWLSGYSGRSKPAQGVASDLWARAVALQDAKHDRLVVVTVEVLGLPHSMNQAIRAQARKQFGLRDEQLLLVATHTHKGPVLPDRPSVPIMYGLNAEQTKLVEENAPWLESQILAAIGESLKNLEPVKLSFGHSTCAFAMNRRVATARGVDFGENQKGPVDHDVPVLVARKSDGGVKAILFGYACHCTTMGGEFDHYYGDHAGNAMSNLENQNTGATALFLTGCGGDANPAPRGTVALAEQHGKELAESVMKVVAALGEGGHSKPITQPFHVNYLATEMPLDKLPTREQFEELRKDRDTYVARHARENLKLLDAGKLPTAIPYPIEVVRFGDELTLVALAGEVVVDYSLRLKRELGAEKLWVVAYANEVPCYIPSRRILEEGGYESGWGAKGKREFAGGSMIYYGWPAPLAVGTEEKIISTVHKLLGQ